EPGRGRTPDLRCAAAGDHRGPADRHGLPLLLHGHAVLPSPRLGAAEPRCPVAGVERDRPRHLQRRPQVDRGRWSGLPDLYPEQPAGGSRHRRADPRRLHSRRVRRQPAGVLRAPPDQRAVPRRLLLPGDPACDPAVRVLHPDRAARHADRAPRGVRRPGRGGVDLHAAQLLRHHPGQPGGGGGDRRLSATAGDVAREPAAGPARDRLERAVHLHDRVERVPLRPAVPRRATRQLDGVPRSVAAGRKHRGADDRADGRLGHPDAPDRRHVLPQRALAGRWPHRRRGEGL
ncbi:MAG: ABC transporter, permease protein, partial [uncultured Nocardioidaceae bacterium]